MNAEGIINQEDILASPLARFMNSPETADVVLCVEDTKYPAHRLILASQSDVLEKLVYGSHFIESGKKEIVIEAVSADTFEAFLTFLYTGRLRLKDYSVELVCDLMELTHRFNMNNLEEKITEYLCLAVNPTNVDEVLMPALLLGNSELKTNCWLAIQLIIEGIYENAELNVCSVQWKELLERPRKVSEYKLFKYILKTVTDPDEQRQIFQNIDFTRMTPRQIDEAQTIVPFNFSKQNALVMDFGDFIRANINLKSHPVVVSGSNRANIFKTNTQNYTTHKPGNCIIIDLGSLRHINHLKFQLKRSWFSYYIEISKNDEDWSRVVDFSSRGYMCEQTLFFPEIVGRYIKFVGINYKKSSELFGLNSLHISNFKNPPKYLGGVLVPSENVATNEKAQVLVTLANSQKKNNKDLLSGNHETKESEYTAQGIGNCPFEIDFYQPYILDSLRLKLWDGDNRKYQFKVEIHSMSRKSPKTIVNSELVSGWQTIRFSPRVVTCVRIYGVKSTIGNDLRLIHFEAPAQPNTDQFCKT